MPISEQSKTRILNNIGNTRSLMLKAIARGNDQQNMAAGDYALMMIALAISNVAEVMLESEEVKRVSTIPDGEVPVIRS